MSIATRRERERRERRVSILDAAREVFAEKGFDQATMGDIAAAAELSKGTLYLYFKSKDALFIALVTRMMTVIIDDFERLAHGPESGLMALRSMLGLYAANMLEHPQLFRIMIGNLSSGHHIDPASPAFEAHRQLVERLRRTFVHALERGREDGSVRTDIVPGQTASQLWGGLLGAVLIRINGAEMARRYKGPTVDLETMVDGYIELVCAGLRHGAGRSSAARALDHGSGPGSSQGANQDSGLSLDSDRDREVV